MFTRIPERFRETLRIRIRDLKAKRAHHRVAEFELGMIDRTATKVDAPHGGEARYRMSDAELLQALAEWFEETESGRFQAIATRLTAVVGRLASLEGTLDIIEREAHSGDAMFLDSDAIESELVCQYGGTGWENHPAAEAARRVRLERDRLRGELAQWENGDRLPVERPETLPTRAESAAIQSAQADAEQLENLANKHREEGLFARAEGLDTGARILRSIANLAHLKGEKRARSAKPKRGKKVLRRARAIPSR